MILENQEYAGFWVRVGAAIVDTIIIAVITIPLLIAIYGKEYFEMEPTTIVAGPADFLISWVFPLVAVIWFWMKLQATPGKMAISAKVVDANTGKSLTLGQSLWRYVGYILATIPLGFGLIWVAFDSKKQGWHDKLANTVVIRAKNGELVKFE